MQKAHRRRLEKDKDKLSAPACCDGSRQPAAAQGPCRRSTVRRASSHLWLSGDTLFEMKKQNGDVSWTSDKSPAKFSKPKEMCLNKIIPNLALAKAHIYL